MTLDRRGLDFRRRWLHDDTALSLLGDVGEAGTGNSGRRPGWSGIRFHARIVVDVPGRRRHVELLLCICTVGVVIRVRILRSTRARLKRVCECGIDSIIHFSLRCLRQECAWSSTLHTRRLNRAEPRNFASVCGDDVLNLTSPQTGRHHGAKRSSGRHGDCSLRDYRHG